VLDGITVRGSIVGTRNDLQEAIDFAADGQVTAHIESTEPLGNINDIFARMHDGAINGRVVLDMTNGAG
jgi:propanol-preferring alcohol dehydrogenase